jgi:hypothetical protein
LNLQVISWFLKFCAFTFNLYRYVVQAAAASGRLLSSSLSVALAPSSSPGGASAGHRTPAGHRLDAPGASLGLPTPGSGGGTSGGGGMSGGGGGNGGVLSRLGVSSASKSIKKKGRSGGGR